VSVLCYIALGIFSKFFSKDVENTDSKQLCFDRNFFIAILSSVLGLVVFLNGIVILYKYIKGFRSAAPFFEGLFATFSGPVFVLIGVCYGLGKSFFKDNELLSLFPVAWGASRTINIFFSYNMVSNVAWNLSDVLAAIFVSLFLLNHAKCIAGIDDPKKVIHVQLYGVTAAIFIFVYTTRNFIESGLTTGGSFFATICSKCVVDTLFALYALFVVFGTSFVGEPKSVSN